MPEDPPISAPEEPPEPPPRPPSTPAPGWMWAIFGLGMVPVGAALFCALIGQSRPDQMAQAATFGGIGGLILGLPMLGGLAIASRFYENWLTRLICGVIFGVVIAVGVLGVIFAGCMCALKIGSSR